MTGVAVDDMKCERGKERPHNHDDKIKEDDGAELGHQARRRGIADAELGAREQRRCAAELEAARSTPRRIASKQVPDRGHSYGSLPSEKSPQSLPPPKSYPHIPILSAPVPVFTAMYLATIDPEAKDQERKPEYQEQRLRERREQLAKKEEALRQKGLQKRGSI